LVDLEMIVPELAGKKVLFLGKSRTMSDEDLALFLEQAKAKRAEGEEDGPLGLIVLGRLVNPLEEAFADRMEKEGVPVVDLARLEAYYAAHIDADVLEGSLALFPNKARMINLLRNQSLPDALFCRLLSLYDWGGEAPFENDENRDVAGALVARFYPEIEKNHNIQYSPLGPFLVAAQNAYAPLLEAMARIPDYEVTQHSDDAWMPRTLREALLINPALPESVLREWMGEASVRELGFMAAHPALSVSAQERLAKREDPWIWEGLARNRRLDAKLAARLYEEGPLAVQAALLCYQPASRERIDAVLAEGHETKLRALGSNERLDEATALALVQSNQPALLAALAVNEGLGANVYAALEATKSPAVLALLAGNPAVGSAMLSRLSRVREKAIYVALAGNPAMPAERLAQFAKIKDRDIHKALAGNPATPIEILLSYQTDGELNRIVKRNEAFGDYIKQNLGM